MDESLYITNSLVFALFHKGEPVYDTVFYTVYLYRRASAPVPGGSTNAAFDELNEAAVGQEEVMGRGSIKAT
jgi:hypothetical protein